MEDAVTDGATQAAALAAALKNDAQARVDPFPNYDAIRGADPVFKCPSGEYYVTGYAEAEQLLLNPKWSSDAKSSAQPESEVLARGGTASKLFDSIVLFTDGEDHARLRKAFGRTLSPRVIEDTRPTCRRFADELLDGVLAKGSPTDFQAEFTQPLALRVMCHILGLPFEEGPRFSRWSHQWLSVLEASMSGEEDWEQAEQALTEGTEYLRPLVEARAAAPGSDIISSIAVAYESGQLSEHEAMVNALFLVVAGHDTTSKTLTNGFYTLLRHPDQYRAIRENPGLAEAATEEILRYDAAARNALPRWSTTDVCLGRNEISRGQKAIGMLNAANRDPAQFPDPERFDIRRDRAPNLGLGRGIHACSGAALARLVIQSALVSVTSRIENMTLVREPNRGSTWNARELDELWVQWA